MAKVKEAEKQSKEFAAMEEAALKAYEEDLKRLEGTKPGTMDVMIFQDIQKMCSPGIFTSTSSTLPGCTAPKVTMVHTRSLRSQMNPVKVDIWVFFF